MTEFLNLRYGSQFIMESLRNETSEVALSGASILTRTGAQRWGVELFLEPVPIGDARIGPLSSHKAVNGITVPFEMRVPQYQPDVRLPRRSVLTMYLTSAQQNTFDGSVVPGAIASLTRGNVTASGEILYRIRSGNTGIVHFDIDDVQLNDFETGSNVFRAGNVTVVTLNDYKSGGTLTNNGDYATSSEVTMRVAANAARGATAITCDNVYSAIPAGTFVTFGGHNKVYQVIESVAATTSANRVVQITPSLRAAVANNAVVVCDPNIRVTHRQESLDMRPSSNIIRPYLTAVEYLQ